MDSKIKLTPCAGLSHVESGSRLRTGIEMPGVDKKDIKLEMSKNSSCLKIRVLKLQQDACPC